MNLLNLMEALVMHIRSKLTTSFYQFLLWSLLLPVYPLIAQRTYSVNANIQVLPPYSVYLSDYVSPGSDKLFVSLMLNDVNEPSYPVKLKFQIEGQGIKIETRSLPPSSILLTQGIQERLSSDDLSFYFNPSNLNFEGLSLDQYIKNGALPEGIYKFSVQAFDGNRNIPISNKASTTVWLILNDPPVLNQSLCNAFVKVVYPQNIFFQWVPMHLNYPNASDNTEYNLRLVQVQPKGRNPNDAMNSSIPIFELNLKETSYFYGLSEPQLIPGQQYAWRVQALDTKKRNLFKNNGFSQVCTFTYGDACEQAQNLKVSVQNSQRVQISWDEASGAKAYKIRYRIKGFDSNSEWYEQEANSNTGVITSLKPNRKYEYQVLTVCEGVDNLLSSIDTFSTNISPQNKNCGKLYTRIEPDNTTILASLNTNDLIMSDGFRIRITESQGSNGQFSGSGVAYVPFINAYLKMNFSNINVNAKYEVFQGDIIAEKASLAKYAKKTSIPVNRDICQTTSLDAPLANENKPRDVKNKEADTPTDAIKSTEKGTEKDVATPKSSESKDESGTSKVVTNDNTPKIDPNAPAPTPNSNNTTSPPEVNTIASIVAEDLNSKGKRKAKMDETLYIVGKTGDKREVKFTLENGLKNKTFANKEVDWSTDFNVDDTKPKYNHGKLGKELVNDYNRANAFKKSPRLLL